MRREARNKELNDLREKIRIQEENIAAKRKEKGCLGLVDDIRFCESATSKMQCMFEDAEYKGAALQALRKEAEKPPEVPDKYGLAVLLEQPFFKPPWLVKAAPGWLAPVTKQREHFQDTAFQFGSDESQPWWLFTYSMITPAQVTLLPLSMEEGMEMPDLSFELCQSAAHLWRRRQFFVAENYKFLHEFNFPDVPWRDIYIQPGLVWMKPGHLGTSLDPLSLDEYLSNLPYIAYGQSSNKSRREGYAAPSARIRMTPEEEWLAEFKRKKAQGNSHQTCKISACKKEIRQLDEEELKEVYEIVETIRAQFRTKHLDLLERIRHYKVEHRGGKYTKEHTDMPVDCCRGVPTTKTGAQLLFNWGLNGEFGCSFKRYDVHVAEMICLGWCDRMAHFAHLWTAAGGHDNFIFNQEHVDSYTEPEF